MTTRKITVAGKVATVFSLVQPDGTIGIQVKKGDNFNVVLDNRLKFPSSIHWHGLILPNNQDGVAYVTQYPLYPNDSYHYQFPLVQAGTFWMHSHFDLQQQQQLSAPLIIKELEDSKLADQDAVLFLSDFSFRTPEQIFKGLRCSKMSSMEMKRADLVDVDYDAFLANSRTLDDPEIIYVQPGKKVRLRIINGSSASNFFLSLEKLEGDAIAVDGSRIKPMRNSRFELAVAQRIDVIVTIPEKGGVFPILAQGEGTNKQTGLLLATKNAVLPKLSSNTATKAGALTNKQEAKLRPLVPLPRKSADQKIILELGGNMMDYEWTINGQMWPNITPIVVDKGSRVEITFKNGSKMSHPMHLHGHVFQVTALNGEAFQGAMRDTVLVPSNSSVTIQFDANNPGVWPLHCHVLYHQEGGMMTLMRYKNYIQPL
jgi:FtsP/CotA-like multicopper oxidase with cupredoxin domain